MMALRLIRRLRRLEKLATVALLIACLYSVQMVLKATYERSTPRIPPDVGGIHDAETMKLTEIGKNLHTVSKLNLTQMELWDKIDQSFKTDKRPAEDGLLIGHPYVKDMVFSQTKLCGSGPVDLFIYFHSYFANYKNRENIRNTWLKYNIFKHISVKYVFVLASPKDDAEFDMINDEFLLFQDTMLGNFIEDFKNLTIKSLSSLYWISTNCPQAKYILKLDDDIFANLPMLVQNLIPRVQDNKRSLFCHTKVKSSIIRKNDSRWYIPEHMLKGEKEFPPHCIGYAVLFHSSLIPMLINASRSFAHFNVDDAFLFGILPKKLNLPLVDQSSNFTYRSDQLKEYTESKEIKFIVIGAGNEVIVKQLWSASIHRLTPECAKQINVTIIQNL